MRITLAAAANARSRNSKRAQSLASAIAVLCAVLMSLATNATAAAPSKHKTLPGTIVTTAASTAGTYTLEVSIYSRKRKEKVALFVTGLAKDRLRTTRARNALVTDTLSLTAAQKLTIRAVAHPRVHLRVKLTAKPAIVASTPVPTPAPVAPAPPTGPGGFTYVGTGPYSTLDTTTSEDFTTGNKTFGSSGTDTAWNYDTGANVCGDSTNSYSASSVTDTNQGLTITATNNSGHWVSGQLDGTLSLGYGAIEASIKMPSGAGMCPAFWLFATPGTSVQPGVSNPYCTTALGTNPNCGEMDDIEAPTIRGETDSTFAIGTLHGPLTPCSASCNNQTFEGSSQAFGDLSSGFHTYGLIWSPGSITWTVDGYAYQSMTPASLAAYIAANPGQYPAGSTTALPNMPAVPWVFDRSKFHMIIDLSVGGWPCSGAQQPCPNPAASGAKMVVQWIHIYH